MKTMKAFICAFAVALCLNGFATEVTNKTETVTVETAPVVKDISNKQFIENVFLLNAVCVIVKGVFEIAICACEIPFAPFIEYYNKKHNITD